MNKFFQWKNFIIKEKFTNLYFTVDGKRENLYREIPCSKSFWNESSIQVETYGIEKTSSGTSLVEFFETYEFSKTNEKTDIKI